MRLGEAMMKEGLINSDTLARALERQIIFGGRLGTNLVEMGAVPEEKLAKFLSKILGVPYAEPALFEDIQQEVLDALPAKHAEKYTAFPIRKERTRLHLAMKDPNDMNALDDLRFMTGLDVRPYIASEMRIVFALEKYYGIKRDLRYVAILDERAASVDPAIARPSPAPPPSKHRVEPTPDLKLEEYLGDESQTKIFSAPAEHHQALHGTAKPQAFPGAKPAPPGNAWSDPYETLASPEDRDQVAEAVVAAAVKELKRAAMFMVKGGALTGWKAAGLGLSDESVSKVQVSLDAPVIFKEVVEDKVFYKGPVVQVPQNTQIMVSLGGVFPLEAIAYPLVIKGKVVGVLYGDNGPGALITGSVEKLSGLMVKASMSLEILILKNKILSDV